MVFSVKKYFDKKSRDQSQARVESMTDKDYEKLGRAMEQVFAGGYASKRRLIKLNFLRGVAYGVGWFIGAVLVVGVVLAFLTRFEEMPVVGPFIQKINSAVNQGDAVSGK